VPAPSGNHRRATLHRLLTEARDLGFLGPGPVEGHLEHADAFAEAVESAWTCSSPSTVADLGSGGGVPGLVLAARWETSSFLLVEARGRRCAFLLDAVGELGLRGRVVVEGARAEVVGRIPEWRGAFDVVTARGFGRPAVVAECAAPLLEVGGLLAVSEPPPDSCGVTRRWSGEGLAELGMGKAQPVGSAYGFVLVFQEQRCPDRFPRRVGVPAKRPLF
jgi:16S rRNA (guanine527-N7)-methyltransferase